MSQGNDFANYASSVEDRSSASEDVWFVAVSSDDIKQMSVDQLDEAFRLGVITAQTAVWTEGMEAWAPLGEVADLDADGGASESEAAASQSSSFAPSFDALAAPQFDAPRFQSPLAPGSSASTEGLPSQRRTSPGWQNPFDAPASNGFSEAASNPLPPAVSTSSMGPSSFAPVTASYAPPGISLGQSTGPVALNVDEDMPMVSRGRRFRPERWLLAAAGVVAVGVIAFNNADLFSSKSMAAAETQASAAALVAHPYALGADKSKGAAPAEKAEKAEKEDGRDAPIGTLKGEAGEEDNEPAVAAEPVTKPGSSAKDSKDAVSRDAVSRDAASKDGAWKDGASKDGASKDSLRGGFAKAFSKTAPAAKPAKGQKPAKVAKLSHKTPSRAAAPKPKKGGVARAASAFDPLNGSLP
jgi:GYF domain 2